MQVARVAAIVLCLALSTAVGTWYLCVRIPENEWSASCAAGTESHWTWDGLAEAERHLLAAVEAAHAFGERRSTAGAVAVSTCASARRPVQGRPEALRLLESSIAIYDKALGPDHAESARVRLYYTSHHSAIDSTEESQPLPEEIR